MNTNEANLKINELRKLILYHNKLYYDKGTQEINDSEYDELMIELRMLENMYPSLGDDTSPSKIVGGSPLKEFSQVVHPVKMLSIEDIHELKEEEINLKGLNPEGNLTEWYHKLISSIDDRDFSLTVDFFKFIRKEKKFKNVDQLKRQIKMDLIVAKKTK